MMDAQPPDMIRSEKPAGSLRDFAFVVCWTVLAALFVKSLIIDAVRIPTGSMENTLLPGDFLLVNKFVYGARTPRYLPLTSVRIPSLRLPALRTPRPGDVIVFQLPTRTAGHGSNGIASFVKRCVAAPGDTVVIENGSVCVNGQTVPLPRHARFSLPSSPGKRRPDFRLFPTGVPLGSNPPGPLVVPERGRVIPISPATIDRWESLIQEEGHVVSRSPEGEVRIDGVPAPTYRIEKNYFFVLGDNRDDSIDSRQWGYVPDDAIVGRAMLVYWSWDESSPARNAFVSRLLSVRWPRIGTLIR